MESAAAVDCHSELAQLLGVYEVSFLERGTLHGTFPLHLAAPNSLPRSQTSVAICSVCCWYHAYVHAPSAIGKNWYTIPLSLPAVWFAVSAVEAAGLSAR